MGFIFEFFKGIAGWSLVIAVLAGVSTGVAFAGFLTGAFIDIVLAMAGAVFDGGLLDGQLTPPDDLTPPSGNA